MNRKAHWLFWLLVGASCVALAAAVLTLSTGTVQADALLSKPAPIALPPAASVTPVFIEPSKTPPAKLHGIASWYGAVFNGRLTASGEVFDMYAMTACQPSLPFGTRVRVVNTANHRSVVVRINDRGYLPNHRVIDLSYAAAQKLHMTDKGLAQVKIQVIPHEHPRANP